MTNYAGWDTADLQNHVDFMMENKELMEKEKELYDPDAWEVAIVEMDDYLADVNKELDTRVFKEIFERNELT